MVVRANLHGGFLAGTVIVQTAAIGHAMSGPMESQRRRELGKFAAVFVLACLAPLCNPYGIGLYPARWPPARLQRRHGPD